MSDAQRGGGPTNLQADFFNRARKSGEKVTIYLVNGKKLTGRLKAFDRYTLLLDVGSSEEVIFKHAISTVSQGGKKRGRGKKGKVGGKNSPEDRGKAPNKSAPPHEAPLSHRMDLGALKEKDAPDKPATATAPSSESAPGTHPEGSPSDEDGGGDSEE